MRPELERIAPPRIKRLKVDPDRGYPVPWFVSWIDGKPEFRVMSGAAYEQAVRQKLCWVCGEPLGRFRWFVIGPMCTINRISAEPPNHLECAEFSARACPFLTKPAMTRRENALPCDPTPENTVGGFALLHNPGLIALYLAESYERLPDGKGGHLFHLGAAAEVQWWTEGRQATPLEVYDGFRIGAERLKEMAAAEGPGALSITTSYTNGP